MINRTVNVRTRDNKVHGEFSLESVLEKFGVLAGERIINPRSTAGVTRWWKTRARAPPQCPSELVIAAASVFYTLLLGSSNNSGL